MDLYYEITNHFFYLNNLPYAAQTGYSIESLKNRDTWAVADYDWYGIAIENKNHQKINEKASGIFIRSFDRLIGNETKDLIVLGAYRKDVQKTFARICTSFCDYGDDGENRERILSNPLAWWEKWKLLLGNVISEKKVYDVLGELLVFEKLLVKYKSVEWSLEKYGVVDLIADSVGYEVKSTTSRYLQSVTVSSQYQLNHENLHLIFVCCEEDGLEPVSINDVVNRLHLTDKELDVLNERLKSYGYEEGSSSRDRKYSVLFMRDYVVDDSFPSINPNSFKDNKIPNGITKITYEISLENIPYSDF